jgi:hypothetical protein
MRIQRQRERSLYMIRIHVIIVEHRQDIPDVAVGLAELEPVGEAPALAPLALPLAAGAAAPGAKAVWLLGKRLLMQPSTHFA